MVNIYMLIRVGDFFLEKECCHNEDPQRHPLDFLHLKSFDKQNHVYQSLNCENLATSHRLRKIEVLYRLIGLKRTLAVVSDLI